VLGEQPAVVHLVDVVAGEEQHVAAAVGAQDVEVLVHRIGGAAVPALGDLLLRRKDVDRLADTPVEEAPAALEVLDQALRLVLRRHADAPHPGIDAIREREVDDAELAGEGHRGLRAPVGERLQACAAAAGEHERVGLLGEVTDVPEIGLLFQAAVGAIGTLGGRGCRRASQ
jgi:hypothetical protein